MERSWGAASSGATVRKSTAYATFSGANGGVFVGASGQQYKGNSIKSFMAIVRFDFPRMAASYWLLPENRSINAGPVISCGRIGEVIKRCAIGEQRVPCAYF